MARKQQKPHSKKPSSKPSTPSTPVPPSETNTTAQELQVALRDQQRLLDIFSHAFNDVLAADDFPHLLREVKRALFERDFDAAFGREEHLRVYAARWSPTRALCYVDILEGVGEHLEHLWMPGDGHLVEAVSNEENPGLDLGKGEDKGEGEESIEETDCATQPSKGTIKMLSIGGCAAEHVALASYLHAAQSHGSLTLVDSAPWTQVIATLQDRITSPPFLSKYASAAAKAANKPLLHEQQLETTFLQNDVLSLDRQQLAALADRPLLITLLFTLNELYTNHGIGNTTAFLKTLGDVLPQGSLLLVVDSPGSYSEAAVGKERKKYPMQWLLDHTLLGTTTKTTNSSTPEQRQKWRRLESQDSIWFRLPDALFYPIQLENMRYQMHLYKREDASDIE